MVCLITSKVLLVVKGGYVGSVGLPSVVGSYIGWVYWSVNLSRLVGLYALIRY